MVPLDTLEQIRDRFQFLEAKMAGGAEAGEIADLARDIDARRAGRGDLD